MITFRLSKRIKNQNDRSTGMAATAQFQGADALGYHVFRQRDGGYVSIPSSRVFSGRGLEIGESAPVIHQSGALPLVVSNDRS